MHLNCYCWPEVGLDMGHRNEREVSLYPLNNPSARKSEHRSKKSFTEAHLHIDPCLVCEWLFCCHVYASVNSKAGSLSNEDYAQSKMNLNFTSEIRNCLDLFSTPVALKSAKA